MKTPRSLLPLLVLSVSLQAMAQWVPTNGPYGALVTSFAVSDHKVFVGTEGAGIFVTTDDGATWQGTGAGLVNPSVQSLAISGTFLYAGVGSQGVYRSSDAGSNWTQVSTGLSTADIRHLEAMGADVYAGTEESGIFRSTDCGDTWRPINSGLQDHRITALAALGPNILAGTRGGVFLSTDKGTNWQIIPVLSSNQVLDHFAVCDSLIYAAPGGTFIYVSRDSGNSWTNLETSYPTVLRCLSVRGSTLYAGGRYESIFTSTDMGKNWQGHREPYGTFVSAFAFSGSKVFAGCWGEGILCSSDQGQSWEAANNGLTGSQFHGLSVLGPNIFASVESAGLFRSTDGGNTWIVGNDGLTNLQLTSPVSIGSDLFVGTANRGVFISTNGGSSWSGLNANLPNPYVSALAASGSNLFVATLGGVFILGRSDAGWSTTVLDIPSSAVMYSFTVAGPNVVAAGNYGAYLITNHGASWEATECLSFPNDVAFASAGSGSNVFIGTVAHQIFRSTNGGSSWLPASLGPGHTINTLQLYERNLFAGTTGGLYLSTDMGASWKKVSEGLPSTEVNALAVWETRLLVGMAFSVVWSRPLSQMVPWNPNLIHNPGFESGTEPWGFYTDGAGRFSNEAAGRASSHSAWVEMGSSGQNVQLYQSGITLKAHTSYRLSFTANSRSGHRLSVFLHKHGAPWTSYGLENWTCDLGTTWKTFMTEFTSENIIDSVNDARLRFWFAPYAQAGDEYFIDDVELVEIEPHLISNGDFEWETNCWEFYTDGAGTFGTNPEADASNHVARVKIDALGSNVQLYQRGITLVAGTKYRLSFRAFSNRGQSLSIYLHKHGTPYTGYGFEWVNLPLTSLWQTFTKEFTATGFAGTVDDGRLRFWLSPFAEPGDEYFFDDVTLERIDGGSGTELVAGAESSEKGLPKEFALFQNYPNPFNPVTIIKYTVGGAGAQGPGTGEAGTRSQGPGARKTMLVVYDVLGRQVATLVDETKLPGHYEVTFDGRGLSSGVYFYRMTAGPFVQLKKMLLIK